MNNQQELFKTFFKDYKWQGLFFRYFKIVLLFVAIPLLTICVCATVYLNYEKRSAQEKSAQDMLTRITYTLDNLSDNMYSIYQQISVDADIVHYLNHVENIEEQNSKPNLPEILRKYTYFQTDYLDSIHLYSFKSNYVISTRNGGFLDNFYDTAWYDTYMAGEGNPFVTFSTNNASGLYPNVLSVSYPIYSAATTKGILVFNIRLPLLLDNFSLASGSNFLLTSSTDGELIYSRNSLYLEDYLAGRITPYIFAQTELEHKDLSIALMQHYEKDSFAVYLSAGIIILCILLSVVLSLYIASIFYTTITEIVTNVHALTIGESPNSSSYAELLSINKSILTMVTKSNLIEKELSQKALELSQAQSFAMQTQINPHFLFNTLNSLNALATIQGNYDSRLSDMILLLSDILTYSLDTGQMFVSLHEELIYTKKYIDIMKIRDNNTFQFQFHVPMELSHHMVLKLCIQPLVENAFVHGLKNKPAGEPQIIRLRVYEENQLLYIAVTDNGPQLPHEKVDAVNDSLKDPAMPNKRHIGLRNVHYRIRLAFGEEYGCRLDSDESGTTAYICVPANAHYPNLSC